MLAVKASKALGRQERHRRLEGAVKCFVLIGRPFKNCQKESPGSGVRELEELLNGLGNALSELLSIGGIGDPSTFFRMR